MTETCAYFFLRTSRPVLDFEDHLDPLLFDQFYSSIQDGPHFVVIWREMLCRYPSDHAFQFVPNVLAFC